MKITKNKLKQIIREEMKKVMEGHDSRDPLAFDDAGGPSGGRDRSPSKKFTHPDYPGVTFTEEFDQKSGYADYIGVDERGRMVKELNPFRHRDEISRLIPMG